MQKPLFTLALLCLLCVNYLFAQGEVYVVVGSDTGIWDGASKTMYNCDFNFEIYTDPTRNGYKYFNDSFRDQFVDSYGTPMKFTWWMHGGNYFRFAKNTNVPLANTMALYLIKKYHGESIKKYGDELSFHYHTFFWSDYDGDGKFYWNQSHTFNECREDWDVTVAQYLLEEDCYAVSFRGGWHFKDNDWQACLNELLPFSLDNDYPCKRTTDIEPLENIFDWSQAPSEWVPYRPKDENYQLPGGNKGWNTRSKHFASVNLSILRDIFKAANEGKDQVPCFWGHIPEADFCDNIARLDSLIHQVSKEYPNVKFRYCTAVEGMQRWLKTKDEIEPEMTFAESVVGDSVKFEITTNEKIWQRVPFVAVKDIYERYVIADCEFVGDNRWITKKAYDKEILARVGCAVTDTVGNLTTKFISYLPDDIFIDNSDPGYSEPTGNWVKAISRKQWGTDFRTAVVEENKITKARWEFVVPQTGKYNLYVQKQYVDNPVYNMEFVLLKDNSPIDTIKRTEPLYSREWNHILMTDLEEGNNYSLELLSGGPNETGRVVSVDVMKISPLVRHKQLGVASNLIDFYEVSVTDTANREFVLSNAGYEEITISSINKPENIIINSKFPLKIKPFGSITINVGFAAQEVGKYSGQITVISNDYLNPEMTIEYNADVQKFFQLVDDLDSDRYFEKGKWSYSVARSYGGSSRFITVSGNKGAYAEFKFRPKFSGLYEALYIVPKTVNASDNALYEISTNGEPIDSVYMNQNENSDSWVSLGKYEFKNGEPVSIKVINTGKTTAGPVLRADAVRINILREGLDVEDKDNLPSQYSLSQNYPNPFNPTTTISYALPSNAKVVMKVYDVLGREVARLVDEVKPAGKYNVNFNANGLSSGVYFYSIQAGKYSETKKLMLLK